MKLSGCDHEKLVIYGDPSLDVLTVWDKDNAKNLIINVCKKCKLLYAQEPREAKMKPIECKHEWGEPLGTVRLNPQEIAVTNFTCRHCGRALRPHEAMAMLNDMHNAENAALKQENAGLNHLIDRVYELLTGGEDE